MGGAAHRTIEVKTRAKSKRACSGNIFSQGTTAWAAVDVTLTAGKPSLLDSGFDSRRFGMVRLLAK
jgi:hypothetical protein